MSYQFPPSSPLMGEKYSKIDPFRSKSEDGKLQSHHKEYPTPNPSSTLGGSSSPIRSVGVKPFELSKPKKVSFTLEESVKSTNVTTSDSEKFESRTKRTKKIGINSDFNILNPDSNVLRVPLVNQRTILVGRSSKSCDYHFKTTDKTISRTHLAVTLENDSIKIECLGYSGFGMRIPRPCLVYGTAKSNDYVLMVAENKPLSFQDFHGLDLKITPRTINLDDTHTEFFVNRNERVTIPKVNNIFIQVRNNILLINPLDDEEDVTEDEDFVLIENPKVILDKMDNNTDKSEDDSKAETKELEMKSKEPQVLESEIVQTISGEANNQGEEIARSPTPVAESTPVKPYAISTPTTPSKSNKAPHIRATSEEPTPSNSIRHANYNRFDYPSAEFTPTHQRTQLNDITNIKRSNEDSTNIKRKKKKTKTNSFIKPEVDQDSIKDIEKLSEVNNVLLNHLAFSRLSSTPASFLITISALTSNMSLTQIRTILHNLKPVGVIYREGKDAAGKPLEEEYYYIPEKDDDPERPKMVASIKGHGGLRSCRRTHKQYYWKKPAPIKK